LHIICGELKQYIDEFCPPGISLSPDCEHPMEHAHKRFVEEIVNKYSFPNPDANPDELRCTLTKSKSTQQCCKGLAKKQKRH